MQISPALYTVSSIIQSLSMFENLQNIARFAQLQLKGINICTFSTKLSTVVKISATVIETSVLRLLSGERGGHFEHFS